MIQDAHSSLPPVLEADVAIAGAGPAGITLALELAERGHQILLIEAGGENSPGELSSAYDNSISGRAYPLTGSRLRWLGGTSNHWGGWVRPLDAVDFEEQPGQEMPGWPFGHDRLTAGFERAATWCEIGSSQYDPSRIDALQQAKLLDLRETGFEHRIFRFSPPTRFGSRYRDALSQAGNIDCRVNLNLVELNQSSDAIRTARAVTASGANCEIRARLFVLAMGGVENARFLLNQSSVPGNQSGLVGRCFMDHFGFTPGLLLADAGMQYERGQIPDSDLMVTMAPARGQPGPNSCLLLSATAPDDVLPPGYWSNPHAGRTPGGHYRISMINAPRPHPQSRVTLSDERDSLGLRQTHLHWHLPPTEFEPSIALFERWMTAISSAGLGRVRWTRRQAPELGEHVGVGYHHMGTTRLSASPDDGVADPNARVWDRDNLYLAGSSLFPSVGFANPTLTIVALAVRLAEHLDTRLQRT